MSDNARNLYDELGVAKDATQEDIKNAFRGLAEMYHPDLIALQPDSLPGKRERLQLARVRFPKIEQAYGWLGDPVKRAQYDKFLETGDAAIRKAPPWFG